MLVDFGRFGRGRRGTRPVSKLLGDLICVKDKTGTPVGRFGRFKVGEGQDWYTFGRCRRLSDT